MSTARAAGKEYRETAKLATVNKEDLTNKVAFFWEIFYNTSGTFDVSRFNNTSLQILTKSSTTDHPPVDSIQLD